MLDLSKRDKSYYDQNFSNLDLSHQLFQTIEFNNCSFTGCNFSETEFLKCKFYECQFNNCNLSMVNIKDSSFLDIVFEDSKTLGINWTQATWPRIRLSSPLRFHQCILNQSSFYGLSLKEIEIIDCKALEVDFREADCSEANFTYTDFKESLFNKTNLTKADFCEAVNYHIDIFNNEIKHAKFSRFEAINLLTCLEIELLD